MISENKSSEKFSNSFKDVGPYLGLGTQLAATIVLMFFLGRWLDSQFKTFPILLILFSFLGGFAGIYNFIKTVLQLNKRKKDAKKS
ncbi:MAG: AtpZ/AtpI family protein [Melioribacter sp.]|nr:AtpZ/AtpI family protein [Melioribacter sp.]